MTKKVYLFKDSDGKYYLKTSLASTNYKTIAEFDVPDNMFNYSLDYSSLRRLRGYILMSIKQAKTAYERIPIRQKMLKLIDEKIAQEDSNG